MIPVTKPYFPDRDKLKKYIDDIYQRQWLTNNGTLVQELTGRLEDYLGVDNLLLVANGTLALQIAYRALNVSDSRPEQYPEAITTPFTFIATASSLKWDGVQPVFADIDPKTWCLNPKNVESAITQNTRAIVPVHVFGNACEVETIEAIARKYNLKVIYDASHAFGVKYKGQSLLQHGDAATLSFHATKIFHTGEGGAIVFKRKEDLERAKKMINFGIAGPDRIEELGINAKMSELQAAMGLCVLDEIEGIFRSRAIAASRYARSLPIDLQRQYQNSYSTPNHAYMPILVDSEKMTVSLVGKLREEGVFARRYFYPSLDQVKLHRKSSEILKFSNDISSRILCLPMYSDISDQDITKISKIVKQVVGS